MSTSESDLRLRIAADASAVKPGIAPALQAVTDLRTHVGNELTQITSLSDKALTAIADHLNVFVRERIPVGGGLFVNLNEGIHGLAGEAEKTAPKIADLSNSIDKIAQSSGKSSTDVKSFLSTFIQLGSVGEKNEAAFKVFGGSVDEAGNRTAALLPQLTQAGTQMAALQAETESLSGSLAAAAGPLALVAVVAAAEAVALYEVIKVTIDASEAFASFGVELAHASTQTKLTVEQLNGLKLLADENKLSFEGLSLGFSRYLRAVIEAQQGNKAFQEEFERLGIDVTKLGEDPQAAIKALIEAFNRLGPSMLSNQAAIQLLGREGVRLLPALQAIGGNLDALTAKSQALRKYTEEDAKAAELLERQMADTKAAIEGYNLELGRTVDPIVLEFEKELLKTLVDNKEIITQLITVFGDFVKVGGSAVLGILKDLAVAWHLVAAEARGAGGDFVGAFNELKKAYESGSQGGSAQAESPADAARRALVPVASTIPINELTKFAGVAPPPPAPIPETEDVTSLRLKKGLEELRRIAAETATQSAAEIAKIETQISHGNAAVWESGTRKIESELRKQSQAQVNFLAEQKRQLEEQQGRQTTEADKAKLQPEINKLNESILAEQSKFQTAYAAKETALRDHLRGEKIKALEADAQIERDAIERVYAARENQGKLSAEAELAATEARNKGIFDIDRQLLANEISIYPKQFEARQSYERKLTELESKRTNEILNQQNEQLKIERESAAQRERISETSADNDLRIARIRGDEEIAELKDRVTRGGNVIDAARAKRLKGIDDEIAKQKSLLNQLQPTIEDTGVVARFNEITSKINQLQVARQAEVGAEENAAEHISKIRVDLINQELNAERAKLAGLKALNLTPVEYEVQQKALNAKISELEEQRTVALKAGARDQADARQKDIDELQSYEDEYSKLVLSGLRLDQEVARLKLQILIASRADARTILNAEIADETARENRQHIQERDRIDAERDAVLKRIRGLKDEDDKKKEIEIQHDLDLEKEKRRHDAAMGLTAAKKTQGELDLQKHDAFADLQKGADAIDRTLHPEKFALAQAGVEALSGAFQSLGQAVGQAVNAFVLYGSAGASVRQVTAQILASIAQQAAVQAIYELAQGLAVLALAFFGVPNAGPSASAHFEAAAMYGVVAGVSAIAGRSVAGNAFKQGGGTGATGTGASGSPSGSGGGSSSGSSQGSSPIVMGSQRGPDVLHLQVTHTFKDTGAVHSYVESAVVKSASGNGAVRQVIVKEVNRQG